MSKRPSIQGGSPGDVPKRTSRDFTMLTIGDRIRYLREVREINQVTLAKQLGLTQAAISNLETDNSRKPSAPTLLKMAAALGANPQWILDGRGDPFEITQVTRESERELIDAYRQMDQQSKAALIAAAHAMKKG